MFCARGREDSKTEGRRPGVLAAESSQLQSRMAWHAVQTSPVSCLVCCVL